MTECCIESRWSGPMARGTPRLCSSPPRETGITLDPPYRADYGNLLIVHGSLGQCRGFPSLDCERRFVDQPGDKGGAIFAEHF
jgi:hypothetical protein